MFDFIISFVFFKHKSAQAGGFLIIIIYFGARGRTRTDTLFTALVPKTSVYTNFTTRAKQKNYNLFLQKIPAFTLMSTQRRVDISFFVLNDADQ
jgi:hypothetical protein